jgi:hypothetical protein
MPDKTELISKKMNAAYELKGGKAVAHYENGQIAMVENAYGSGKAIMTGFSPGLAYLLSPDKLWVSLLQSWVKDICGTTYDSDSIFTRILETEKGKIFFLFNKTDKVQSWKSPNNGNELIASVNVEKGGCVTLGPNGVSVVHFPKMS